MCCAHGVVEYFYLRVGHAALTEGESWVRILVESLWNLYGLLVGKPEIKDDLEDLGVDGIIFILILEKCVVKCGLD